ncbi:ABC transporter ATP-binding protein [Variovorax sp. PCZ-1]|uniref:ABC transporter ATP-binding protein n=1 Tax=Variovorax sp. PCZ-1 TaxID=2835533 RepID=UPI001BCA6C62|nr:ABC transporter ATP-binding protein [Variovorax sp. PCZ-1]MBS7808889.1 ABC transporter ATP-binding protein [Variovorax sp. PCZ-1]
MASISLKYITKKFHKKTAINALNLDIQEGEFFVLLGPSGAGKTTTLRLISGLEKPDQGSILFNSKDVANLAPAHRDCAFVFQQYSLYPHLTVYDNMAFPLRSPLLKTQEAEIKKRVHEIAELLHMESKLQRKATALSGGEMQRVAIGRALVRRPQVYLMDEPLSSLDAKLREELRVELRRIQKSTGSTVVYVTHDQVEATTMADRIGILEEGHLEQVGTPQDIYSNPSSLKVAQRLGSPAINVLPTDWLAGNTDIQLNTKAAFVAIRPEDISIMPASSGPVYKVIECSLAKHLLVTERSGVEVRVSQPMDHSIAPGSTVSLGFSGRGGYQLFGKAGERLAFSH